MNEPTPRPLSTPRPRPSRAPTALAVALGVALGACASAPGTGAVPADPAAVGGAGSSDRATSLAGRVDALAAADTAPGAGAVDGEYRVGADDVLDVSVFGAADLSAQGAVSESGALSMPLIGPVPVAGLTPVEVEARLREELLAYVKEPHVTVRVVEARSRSVSVIGAVNRPGVYEVRGGTTLLEALALAGGLSDDAGGRVQIMRGGTGRTTTVAGGDTLAPGVATASMAAEGATRTLDLRTLVETGDPSQNPVIGPGDVVNVSRAGIVYVLGQVNRPGGFPVQREQRLGVLQAVALAEGMGRAAAPGRSVIIRSLADGTRREIPLDLGEALESDDPENVELPALEPGDVLFVPRNGMKAFALGAVDALVRMVTLRGLIY